RGTVTMSRLDLLAGPPSHPRPTALRQRFRHARCDERGFSLIWAGFGFMALFAATTLAVDIGMMMTARTQAQTAADAGALAGATALVFNSYSDHSSGGPAVQGAVNTAKFNQVIGADVAVEPGDVTFLNDPAGKPNRVRVQV